MTNIRFDYPIRFEDSPSVVVTAVSSGTPETLALNLTPNAPYYLSGDDQTDDLMRALRLAIASYASASLTATVSLNASFQCEITFSEDAEINWSHANTTPGLAEYFGFDSASDSIHEPTETSITQPYGIWRPGRSLSQDSRPLQPIVGGILMSLAGNIEMSRVALPTRTRDVGINFVVPERALQEYAEASRPYDTFEQMWLDAATQGQVLRLYLDEADRGDTDYWACKVRSTDTPLAFNDQTRAYWRNITMSLQGAT